MVELVAPVTGCPSGELRFALSVTFSPESRVSGALTPHLCVRPRRCPGFGTLTVVCLVCLHQRIVSCGGARVQVRCLVSGAPDVRLLVFLHSAPIPPLTAPPLHAGALAPERFLCCLNDRCNLFPVCRCQSGRFGALRSPIISSERPKSRLMLQIL